MSTWHSSDCDTTHCRAGWVVKLGGEKAAILEQETSTLFAAMLIYDKSCPEIVVNPPRFFASNEVAMKDIERCALEESKLVK